jgi:hypothetical protein
MCRFVPRSVRDDAIQLVRSGQTNRGPEFFQDKAADLPSSTNEDGDENAKFRGAYSIVGELVLITTVLDHQPSLAALVFAESMATPARSTSIPSAIS